MPSGGNNYWYRPIRGAYRYYSFIMVILHCLVNQFCLRNFIRCRRSQLYALVSTLSTNSVKHVQNNALHSKQNVREMLRKHMQPDNIIPTPRGGGG